MIATRGARPPAAAASASCAVATTSATVTADFASVVELILYVDSAKIYGIISSTSTIYLRYSRCEFFFGINLFDHALIIRPKNKITTQLIKSELELSVCFLLSNCCRWMSSSHNCCEH